MNTKLKTTLIIIFILIIGIIIGVLGTGVFVKRHMREFGKMMHHKRFSKIMERIIQPTDAQQPVLDKILSQHFKKMKSIHTKHRSEIFTVFDSLKTDLEKVLTEGQITRLHEHLTKSGYRLDVMHLMRLARELDLDDEQLSQLEDIYHELAPSRRGWHRYHEGHRHRRKKFRKEQYDKLNEEIEAILTPVQKEKFREMRKDQRFRNIFFGSPPFGRRMHHSMDSLDLR